MKNEILLNEKKLNIDEYLEVVLKKYEGFYINKREEFNSFLKKAEGSLYTKLLFTSLHLRDKEKGKEKELLKIFKKHEEKITKKDIEIDKAVEEKRKLLILAIKRII